jgi:hypothetical protein
MKTFQLGICLLLMLAACAWTEARAQVAGDPENWCRNGSFTDDAGPLRLASVAGRAGERAHFWSDEGECPNGSATRCRLKSYLVPGDEVVVSRRYGQFVCAWFQPRAGRETIGWLAADRLNIHQTEAEPPLSAWAGEWEYYENSISIRRGARAGDLAVEGQAYWKGLGDNVHVGEIGSIVRPAAGEVHIEDDTCRVTMRLVGPYLVVGDNGQCGGVNVAFDGVYRRKPPRGSGRAR